MPANKRNCDLPQLINDPILGKLRFTAALDGMDEYQTKFTLDGRRITIDLYTDESGSLQPCMVRARKIVQRYPAIKKKIQTYIQREIYPTYNATYREGKKSFTLEQVMRQLKLTSITTHPGPQATFWFDAGNHLDGHSLQVFVGERNKIVDHDMPG